MPTSDPTDAARRVTTRYPVGPQRFAAWLPTATNPGRLLIVDGYGIDDTFRLDGDDLHGRIQVLIHQAQHDGVLSVPGHDLILWQAGEEGFLLTIDPPSPPRLCSRHLEVRDLLPERASGSLAAVAVLTATAAAAQPGVLDEQDRAHDTAVRATTPVAFHGQRPDAVLPQPLGLPAGPASNPAGPHRPHHRR